MGKSATIPEDRLSKQIGTNDDAAAYQEEVEEQTEGDDVEKESGENGTGGAAPIMRSNKEMAASDDAAASGEEQEEQAAETLIGRAALEDGISTPSAEEYIARVRLPYRSERAGAEAERAISRWN